MKKGDGGTAIRQPEDGARLHLSSLSLLLFFSLCNKNKRKKHAHAKELAFCFRLGTRKRTEVIGREEGYAEAWRGSMGKANPALSPHPVKQEKKGEGLPFPSYSSYLGFLSCNERNAFLTGRAKKRIEER